MNAFVCDRDPYAAAQALADPHVVKMPIEVAQVLCTVADHLNVDLHSAFGEVGIEPYKPTHRKHPVTLRATECEAYRWWLMCHGIALCDEYCARYGKKHKALKAIEAASVALDIRPCSRLEVQLALTGAPLAMPDECKRYDSQGAPRVVDSYRAALADKYRAWSRTWRVATWTNAEPPAWLPADVPVRMKSHRAG